MLFKKRLWKWLGFTVIISLMLPYWLCAQTIDDLSFLTEQYPPYNFQDDEGVRGIAVDVLLLMLARTESRQTRSDIELGPWARGYRFVLEKPNICLFSMTLTDERAPLFKWVGPIMPTRIVLIAKKSRKISVQTVEELEPYTIGVVLDDIGEQLLQETGAPLNLDALGGTDVLVRSLKKLEADRLDLWAYEEHVAKFAMMTNGFEPDEYEAVYTLTEAELYYAFSKDTPDPVIQQLQQALDDLKAGGDYQKVLDAYIQ